MTEAEYASVLRSHKATSVTSDSRKAGPGTVFVAIRGSTRDGHAYIGDAASAGAALIVGEDASPESLEVPYLRVKDSRTALSALAAELNGHPSRSMRVIGVTGTSGKTTTTYLLESILQAAGERVGVIGTVNIRFQGEIIPASHTTPDAADLQAVLRQMQARGCTAVVMEVSSHALDQQRVAHVAFDGAIFTNLSPEHLDYHPDMDAYFAAKAVLFRSLLPASATTGKNPVGALNTDDPFGKALLEELRKRPGPGITLVPFSLPSHLRLRADGLSGEFSGLKVKSPLVGGFNASNIAGAVALSCGLGIPEDAIKQGVANLNAVPGRLEAVANTEGLTVLVDYAHKPDALEKVLRVLQPLKGKGRIITVFGCGGDRDRTKRPVMGRLAAELSDLVFVTSDNPRTENPEKIIREIIAGVPAAGTAVLQVEPDRRAAIHAAVALAETDDLILIAGKGHEDYQLVADPAEPSGMRKLPFDDRVVASDALKHRAALKST